MAMTEQHPRTAKGAKVVEGLLGDRVVGGEPIWSAHEPASHRAKAVPHEEHSAILVQEARVARGVSRRGNDP